MSEEKIPFKMQYGPQDWACDSHLENGNYANECHVCGCHFIGYKRRTVCFMCAQKETNNEAK